ncbi:ASPM-like protein [Mya arenaria]|uniref:ASPM-like protein n=1 Tax=Mya arenaria TaxID=6604 RepID=A0ABY7DFN4_MYAAR|nr:ASPM-like protein [Mya arenaria]
MSGVSILSGDRGEGVSTFEFSMLDQAVPYPSAMAGLPTSTPNPGKARRKSRRSWFENTPKGFKFEIAVDKSELQEPVRRKSENMEVLTLTHFTAPPRLGFGTLKLGQERMCTLMLRNPHDYEQSVKVEKVPEKKNFTVNCREVVVGPNDSFPLEITWVPKDAGGCREMVLMQIDNSYRLQAYVFGTVTEPPKKKKTSGKRTGLLASKASRPFSVIQTSSLANIDHAYSPEKKPTRPGSRGAPHTQDSRARKPAVTVGVKGVGQNSKPGRKSVGKKSEEGRRRSSRNSGQFRESETVDDNDENVDPVEVERPVKRSSGEGPQGTVTKSKPGSVVPRKKMRRSNTYSNVSGNLGLVVPIIHNDQVLGLKDTSLINIDDCNISGIQVLEQSHDRLNAEPSFLETTVEPKSNCPNPSFIKKIETKSDNTVAYSAPKLRSNSMENKQDEIKLDEREDPSFLVPTKNVLTQKHLNDSLQDSLEMEGNQENVSPADEPSFLKPEVRSQNIRRKSLRRSGRFDSSEEPTGVRLLRSVKRNSSRPVDNDGHIVKAKKRRSSSEGSAVLKQLKNLKSFIHNKSLEIESSGNESGLAERLESEVAKCVERRETFVKTRTSPRFSMPAAESFRRGTFVTGSEKLKMLDEQAPSEASPRRTTFTVIKGGNKKSNMAGEKKLESKLVEEDEQTENDALHKIDEALKANVNSSENPDADRRPKMERMYSADSLENEDSLEEKFGSPNKILAAPTEEFSRRATLTVTKSRPSDALLNHHIHNGGVHTSLFKPDCIQEELAASDKTDGNRSSQNSTFEVSADKSILLKDANFQATPNHLPTSPNPNHSRRSTHVVYQPKVLNLSCVAGKQLFSVDDEPSFLQANSDKEKHAVMEPSFLEEKKESCERIPAEKTLDEHVDDNITQESESNELDKLDKVVTQKEEKPDISENDLAVENSLHVSQLGDPNMPNEDDEHGDVFSPPSANTRRRTLSARRSVGAQSVHNLSMEEIKDKFTAVDKANSEVFESKKTATDAEVEAEGGLFFIPMNDSGPKQEAPARKPNVKPDPKRFLKKRSNPVAQEVDVRTKRVCSESSAPLRSSVSARPVPKSTLSATRNVTSTGSSGTSGLVSKANTTRVVSRGPIKSSGNSGAGRQPMKPRLAASKGLSQSVLILSKKTKSVIPKHPLAFAAKNMYYDERWMEKQERGFVNWLNFILTPADEVQGSDVKVKVDAGKLTLELEKGRGKLAPTNEILSFRTYSAHRKLNRLRKSACRLFQSDAIRQVIHKLEREVESRRLLVRKDKMIHADLGAKQRLLDMLLSYNPLWLRVGLETIYGEVVPLQSNSDVYGLSRFIITRLLTSPDIAQEYSHPTVPHLYRDGYGEASAQHTLKKFLMLVYFLDQAKLQRIIDHNPCLFCKDSEYKASRDLLLQMSRDFLSGEGDINRHLGYLGYKVMYTQTALDEFDFAVKKLAIDLRDGVRLTRVVEMLCGRTDLSVQLRMPAISRLQKVHNIKLVFKALTDQNIDPGKSTPADIVEGHREKTLALLWAIILHYQVAVLINEEQLKEEVRLLERSLAVRQRLSRLAALKPVDGLNHRNSDAGDLHTQDDRLNLLLKWCRAVCAHFNIQIENFTVSFSDGRALCHIMHYYQPGLLPLAAIRNETTVTHLADMEKKCQQNLDCSFNDSASSATVFGDVEDPVIFEGFMNNEKENFKLLAEKVRELGGVPMMLHWGDMCNTIPDEKVVVTYLLHLCARLLDIRHESRAARVIQHAWRTYRLKKMEELYKRQEKAAVCIQRVWRGHKARLETNRRRLEKAWKKQIVAVSLIQTAVKKYLHRRRYLQMKASVNEIQAYCKGYLYRQTRERAALTIQRVYRGFRARVHISKMEEAATRIQAFVRGYIARKMAREYLSAVRVVQARFRAQQAMGKQRCQYKKVKESCITIQRFWRELKITREMRDKFVTQRAAAVKIQSKVRMMLQRAKYQKLRSAAVTIQSHVRSFRVRKAFKVVLHHSHHAATIIQAAFRGYQVRMQLRVESAAATYIQACYRCYYMNKRWRKLREAAVACQRLYRAKLAGKRQREIYRSLKCAAITLQAQFRMIQCRRPYLEQKEAAVRIQSFYRCQLARQAYQKQRESACVIQTYFRAYMACKQQALEYHRLRCATIRIQSAVRCYLVRKQFLEMKNAAVSLQAACRGYLFRKHRLKAVVTIQKSYRGYKVRKDVDRMNKAAVRIQTCFRRFIALRKFTAQKGAALVIQARYKAFAEMKKQQNSYEETKKACISIQRYWRQFVLAKNVRNQFIRQREAAVKIQANVRRMIQRGKYQKLKAAAVIIQSHIRSYRVRKAFKVVLYHSQTSATTIQAAFRGYLVRRQLRKEHDAATAIQACYRRFSQSKKYKSLCQSAIVCQRLIRAKQAGQKQRIQFCLLRQATIVLQAQYRMVVCRRQFTQFKSAAVVIQSRVRGHLAQQSYNRLREASIVLQKHWRAHTACKKQSEQYNKLRSAAIVLQSSWRGHKARSEYVQLRASVVKIQAGCRGFLFRSRRQNAAVVIQTVYRGFRVRKELTNMSAAATRIQAYFRRYRAEKVFAEYNQAAVCIQRLYRAQISMKTQKSCFNSLRKSCIAVQRLWRANTACKKQSDQYNKLRSAAIVLQSSWRGHKARSEYLQLRASVVKIQAGCQGFLFRSRRQKAAVKIQTVFRGYKVRKELTNMSAAATRIQACFRRQRAVKMFTQYKQAAVSIQRWYRAQIAMNSQKSHFNALRQSCVAVQRLWRANKAGKSTRQSYLAQRCAAVKLQANVRMMIQRSKYQRLKTAAMVIQSHIRSHRVRKAFKVVLCHSHHAATTLQAAFRGYLVRRQLRIESAAATYLQACYRCAAQRRRYCQLQKSAVVCQQRYRAKRECQKQFVLYSNLKKAAVAIQSQFRMIQCRREFMKSQAAAIKIQSWFRGTQDRAHFLKTRKAACVLQNYWRAELKCRRQFMAYHRLRDAVIALQSFHRGNMARKEVFRIRAAVKIQAFVRMTQARAQYSKYCHAALRIQGCVRVWQARKELNRLQQERSKVRESHLAQVVMVTRVNMAAIRIQRCYRNHCMMKIARERMHSILAIQVFLILLKNS